MSKIKISIITVTFNSQDTIKESIESVISQTYDNIEYIIVDGASDDGTMEIIKSFKDQISKIICEPDQGLYDAMNKGISIATGSIIGLLNSDDIYSRKDAIDLVINQLLKEDTDIVYADIDYVRKDNTNKIVRKWRSGSYKKNAFQHGWHPAHPTFFAKRKLFTKFGFYDLDFPLAADFELMLRFIEKHKINHLYLPETLIKMRLGGITNKSIKNILKQNIECYQAFKKNNIKVSKFYPVLRIFPKLKQFF